MRIIYCCVVVVALLFQIGLVQAQEPISIGADVIPGVEISIEGGRSQSGKPTLFSGAGLNFGGVTFTNPGAISNGDAYLDNGKLILEAVLETNIVFSGGTAVDLTISKLPGPLQSFNESYFTLTNNRSAVPKIIFDHPRANDVTTITKPETVTLRMLFEVTPQQSGNLSDQYRVTTTLR